jgi:uncharacterized protein with HEPN domain
MGIDHKIVWQIKETFLPVLINDVKGVLEKF